MRTLWLVGLSVVITGAGIYWRARRRADTSRPVTTDPVSGQWLAEARGRDEQYW